MERSSGLDFLKLALAIMVVGLHAHLLQDSIPHLGYILVNGVFRVAVPVFLIINGYYLFDAISGGRFLKWIKRVVVLYFFWMLLYSLFWAFPESGSGFDLLNFIHKIIFGYHHLWYVSGIIGGAVLVFLARNLGYGFMVFSGVLFFVFGVFIQYAGELDLFGGFIGRAFDYNWAHRNFVFFAYPFMLIGFMLKAGGVSAVKPIYLLFGFVVAFFGLMLEVNMNFYEGIGVDGFDNLFMLIFFAPVVFLVGFSLRWDFDSKIFSSVSSGIYFVHPALLKLFSLVLSDSVLIFSATIFSSFISALFLLRLSKRFPFII